MEIAPPLNLRVARSVTGSSNEQSTAHAVSSLCTKIPNIALNCSKGSICASSVLQYPDCPLGRDFCILADPDVVGLGVLVAFVVTAAFALFTAYFVLGVQLVDFMEKHDAEESHPHTRSTSLRKAAIYILRCIHSCLHYQSSRSKRKRSTRIRNLDSTATSKVRRQRLHKFGEDFLLALSDQQLVTGLAILTAGWASRKNSTVYQFEMVTDLAWMSSDVHLLSVGQLRGFFKENSHARHWRAIGMLCTFVLLFVANVYQGHFEWFDKFRYPAQCLFDDLHQSPPKVHGKAAAYMYVWTAFLVYGYGRGIIPLYLDTESWRDNLLSQRASLESQHHRPRGQRFRFSKLKLYLLDIFWIISSEAFNVLIVQTLWFIYGSWSVWVDRRDANRYGILDQGDTPWSFGQIVPLFLLGLPVLNAIDFFVALRNVKVERRGVSQNPDTRKAAGKLQEEEKSIPHGHAVINNSAVVTVNSS